MLKKIYSLLLLCLLAYSPALESRVKRTKKKQDLQQAQVEKPKKAAGTSRQIKQSKEAGEYRLWIGNVDCKVCAKAAVDALYKLPDISSPQYLWVDDDSSKSLGACVSTPASFKISPLECELGKHKFSLKGIKGIFYGTLTQQPDGRWGFVLIDDSKPFEIRNPDGASFVSLIKKKTVIKKPVCVAGSLFIDGKKRQLFVE